MAKFFELPAEQSICCIPLKHAVYCRACLTVSNSRPLVCGFAGVARSCALKQFSAATLTLRRKVAARPGSRW